MSFLPSLPTSSIFIHLQELPGTDLLVQHMHLL